MPLPQKKPNLLESCFQQGGFMTYRRLSLLCMLPAFLLCTAAAAPAQTAQPPPSADQTAPKSDAKVTGVSSPADAPPLPAGIDKVIEKALDKKLAPIMRTLAEMQEQKIRLTDVLGGLGYIFGLVGVAAYFKSRGKRKIA
jgi:nickel transport protein